MSMSLTSPILCTVIKRLGLDGVQSQLHSLEQEVDKVCCHRDTSCGICLYPLSTAGPFCSFYYSKDSLVRSLPWQLPYLERLLDLPLEHRRGTPWCPNMVPLGLNLCWYSEHQNSLLGSPINCFKSLSPWRCQTSTRNSRTEPVPPLSFWILLATFPPLGLCHSMLQDGASVCGLQNRAQGEVWIVGSLRVVCVYIVVSRERFRSMVPLGPCLQRF